MEKIIQLDEAVEITLPKEIQLIRKFLKEEQKAQSVKDDKNERDKLSGDIV